MARIAKPVGYCVNIVESERGWGRKIDEAIYFDNAEEACAFVKEYNDKYNPPCDSVPDWYMVAEYAGAVA